MGLCSCGNFSVDVEAPVYRQTIGSVSARLYLASRSDRERGNWIGKTLIWTQTGSLQQKERVLNGSVIQEFHSLGSWLISAGISSNLH